MVSAAPVTVLCLLTLGKKFTKKKKKIVVTDVANVTERRYGRETSLWL